MPLEYPFLLVDANSILGKRVDDSNIADGRVLKYDATLDKIVYDVDATGGGGGSGNVVLSRIVFFENFTGNAVDNTFTLTGNIQNATFAAGSWEAGSILNTMQSDVVSTTDDPIYSTGTIFTRNRISVVSINTISGLVTLDYIPQNLQQFRIYYWYLLDPADSIEDYYRTDYVSQLENNEPDIASSISVDTANFSGLLSATETTSQILFDRIDDFTYIPNWASGQSYRLNNAVINDNILYYADTAHTSGATFIGDIANWTGIGVLYLDELFDVDSASSAHGSILFKNVSDIWDTLEPGTAGYFLKTQGAGADPIWTEITGGLISHSDLNDLSADDHSQYAYLAGRAGGQILIGGTAAGDDLTLQTTSNITKGSYFLSDLTSNGLVKTSNGTGLLSIATADSDYQQPVSWGDGLSYSAPTASVDYNTTNLKITTGQIDTIQSIALVATPTFASMTLSSATNQLVLGTTNTTTINSTAPGSSRIYTIPDAGAAANFIIATGTHAQGDTLYYNGTTWTSLSPGIAGQYLKTQGAAANPIWASFANGVLSWQAQASNTTAVAGNGYITTNDITRVEISLPDTPSVGNLVRLLGHGDAGWKVVQPADTLINFGMAATTTGIAGYIQSTDDKDAVELICVVAAANDYRWNVASSVGNIELA